MQNLLGMSADWLAGKVRELDAAVAREDLAVRDHLARVARLEARVPSISDAARRAVAGRTAAQLRTNANRLASMWNAVASRYRSAKAAAVSWLRSAGALKGSGLEGLGVLPAVPITIAVSIAVTVWGAVALVRSWREPELRRVSLEEKAFDALAGGGVTPDEYRLAAEQRNRATELEKPKGGVLGLDLAGIVTPIVVLVGGYFVVRAIMSRPSRRGA